MRNKYFFMVESAFMRLDDEHAGGLMFKTLVVVTREREEDPMDIEMVFTVYENSDLDGYPSRSETCLLTWTETGCGNTSHLAEMGWSDTPFEALKELRRRAAHQGGWGVVRLCNKRLLTEAGHSRLSLERETYKMFPNP